MTLSELDPLAGVVDRRVERLRRAAQSLGGDGQRTYCGRPVDRDLGSFTTAHRPRGAVP